MKKFFKEFKAFITRGNVIDMAVGVIVGGAFTAIVTALTTHVFQPLVNWALAGAGGGLESAVTMLKAVEVDGVIDMSQSIYIDWGAVISAVLNFLIIALIPFTRLVAGKAIGPTAAIVPLVIGAAPFVARLVEQSLQEVDTGVIEAAKCMGATRLQIILQVLLGESLPSLIRGLSITAITLIGYSAMAGTVGAGGLGDIAIRYGYYRYQTEVMLFTILLLVLLVCLIQFLFGFTANRIDKRNRS